MGTMWMPRQSGLLQSRRDFIRVALMAGPVAMALPSMLSAAKAAPNPMIVPVKGLATPEDLGLIPETDWIVTSASATTTIKNARTYFVNVRTRQVRPAYPDNCTAEIDRDKYGDMAPPEMINFHGLDIIKAADGTITLYQINHKAHLSPTEAVGREAIEVFTIRMTPAGPTLQWRGAIPLPSWAMANDCCALPEGGVAVTNIAFGGPESFPAMVTGRSSGNVIEWHDRQQGWSVVEGTDINAPNGIAVSANGEYLFICSSAKKQLLRISRKNPHGDRAAVDLGAMPDNVTWTPDGQLLIAASVGEMPEFFAAAAAGKLSAPLRALKVDPVTLKVQTVIEDNPGNCIISTVLQVNRNEIWAGGLGIEDRLLAYQV